MTDPPGAIPGTGPTRQSTHTAKKTTMYDPTLDSYAQAAGYTDFADFILHTYTL